MRLFTNGGKLAAACLLFIASTPARADHVDFEIGRDDKNALVIEGDPALFDGSERIELFPGDGIFDGLFINDVPGWENVSADEPPDLFRLLPGHRVALQRVSFSPGFAIYDPFTAIEILAADGDFYEFPQAPPGSGDFHVDLIFAAGGVPGDLFSATFQLIDLAGLHLPSKPFTLSFVNVPEPGSATFALLGLAALRRRVR